MPTAHPDPDVIALGVQQPWADLLVSGRKTLEIRSRPTNVRGTIYIYASKRFSTLDDAAKAVRRFELDPDVMVRQELVGTVELVGCRPATADDARTSLVSADVLAGHYAWSVTNPVQFAEPLPVLCKPYGVWFYPYREPPAEE